MPVDTQASTTSVVTNPHVELRDRDDSSHSNYRYNHFPSRSSSCYSSSNLSSTSPHKQQWAIDENTALSSPRTACTIAQSSSTACISTSDSSSLSSPPPSPISHDKRTESLSRDDFSIQSVLSLYQAFAIFSERSISHDNHVQYPTVDDGHWARNASIDEYDERTQLNGREDNLENQGDDGFVQTGNDVQCCHDDAHSTTESKHQAEGRNIPKRNANSDETDDDDEKSITSLTSFLSSTPSNMFLASTNYIYRNRKKVASLLLSIATVCIYAQRRESKQFRRRYFLSKGNNYNHSILGQKKLLGIYRWLIQLLSPFRISKYFHQIARSKQLTSSSRQIQAPRSSSPPQSWKNAPITPLSHLLAMSKSGNIYKVLLRGPVLLYLHSIQSASPSISSSSSSSSQPQLSHKQQRWSQTTLPSRNPNILNEIITTLLNHGCDDITTLPESLIQRALNGPAVMALPFAYLAVLYWMMRRLQRQQFDDGDRGEGSNSWKKDERHTTTFDDVAGIDSSLQELSEVISYMRNPETFHSIGARPPRGILLHGPPGSGKTLLARAIAGEAERCVDGIHHLGGNSIDCFAVCSGSDFVETYVGRGAARVRGLFQHVREEATRNFKRRQRRQNIKRNFTSNEESKGSERGFITRTMKEVGGRMVGIMEGMQSLAPSRRSDTIVMSAYHHHRPMAIIFIDEIDCLAKRRDSGFGIPSSLGGAGCDEREQTLNALLTEMDGFDSGDTQSLSRVNVIVIAATNRPEVLDPAVLRPGRFDRHVRVALPDAGGREAILRVHARRIRWDRLSVDFAKLPTHNFSGADLKNVINEAALLAVRSGSTAVNQSHLLEAVQKVRAQLLHYEGTDSRH